MDPMDLLLLILLITTVLQLWRMMNTIMNYQPPSKYVPDPNLLRDAIEDAKVVRQTALLNIRKKD